MWYFNITMISHGTDFGWYLLLHSVKCWFIDLEFRPGLTKEGVDLHEIAHYHSGVTWECTSHKEITERATVGCRGVVCFYLTQCFYEKYGNPVQFIWIRNCVYVYSKIINSKVGIGNFFWNSRSFFKE